MQDQLPRELEQFVQQEIAAGKYPSATAVITAALQCLQAQEAPRTPDPPIPPDPAASLPATTETIIRAIAQALATGEFGRARHLALEGTACYPNHAALQQWARVLAPPTVHHVGHTQTSSLRASRTWLKAHWQDYRGQWVAVRDGHLVAAAPSFDAVIAHVGDVQDTLLTYIPA